MPGLDGGRPGRAARVSYKVQLDGAAARVKLIGHYDGGRSVGRGERGADGARDAGKSVGIDCLSRPLRASSSADAPEEKEADELEALSPTSPPDIPT